MKLFFFGDKKFFCVAGLNRIKPRFKPPWQKLANSGPIAITRQTLLQRVRESITHQYKLISNVTIIKSGHVYINIATNISIA
jgi:hypothetical protein